MKFGFLRETDIMAQKAGVDTSTGLPRTGLEIYLSYIFPNCNDWIHDRPFGAIINGKKCLKRPDYRSESLKLIVEFDGLLHYQNPLNIINDVDNAKTYKQFGYKVVRIPYFIQMTKENVKRLFGVNIDSELFPNGICSFSVENKNTPAFLCIEGVKRMAKEFQMFPDVYEMEIANLLQYDDTLTGASVLSYFYQNS